MAVQSSFKTKVALFSIANNSEKKKKNHFCIALG